MPELSPESITAKPPTMPTKAPMAILALANLVSLLRSRNQALTPMVNTPPVIHPLNTAWKNLLTAIGFPATAQNDTISLRTVSGLNDVQTGFCIQAFATKIQ